MACLSCRSRLVPAFLLGLLGLLVTVAFRPQPAPGPRESRAVPAFTAISLGTSATVIVRQGSPQQVAVEAAPEDQSKLQTEVANAQLRIERRPGRGWLGSRDEVAARFQGPVTVYVTVPTLTGLVVSSSGQLRVDSLQATRLRLAVSGSGQLRVGRVQASQVQAILSGSGSLQLRQLRADSLRASVAGSGSFMAAGTCGFAALGSSSSGRLSTGELAVQECRVRLSGSGSGQVSVTRALEARLSSSGGLLVQGNPQLTSHVSGSGRVRQQQ